MRAKASRLPSLFLAIVCSLDVILLKYSKTLAAYEDMLWDLRVIRTEKNE